MKDIGWIIGSVVARASAEPAERVALRAHELYGLGGASAVFVDVNGRAERAVDDGGAQHALSHTAVSRNCVEQWQRDPVRRGASQTGSVSCHPQSSARGVVPNRMRTCLRWTFVLVWPQIFGERKPL